MDLTEDIAFMLPKENAATVMARESEFSFHVIPEISTDELLLIFFLCWLIKNSLRL